MKGTYAWELANLGYASAGTTDAFRSETMPRVMGALQYTHLQNPFSLLGINAALDLPAAGATGVIKVTVDLCGVAKGCLGGLSSLEGLLVARDRRRGAFCGPRRLRVDILVFEKW